MPVQEASKGPQAFRTISEASSELGVPQHVLRFWETKFSFIRPMKRAGGRRFYRPQDLAVLKGVRTLLHKEGYTIKGVQRLHKEEGVRRLLGAAGTDESDVGLDILLSLEAEAATPREEPPVEEITVARPPPPSAEPANTGILRNRARSRLETVLRDIEQAKAAVDHLLAESDA